MITNDILMMTLISQRVGSILSDASVSMTRHLSSTLTEEPHLKIHIANIGDKGGRVYPALVEANPEGYILYGQDGHERRLLLRCSRENTGKFSIEDGEFAIDIVGLG